MTDWTSLRYAVVDVEGNGQQPPDLVELAIVPIVGGQIGESTSWLIKPPRRITYLANRIHGIGNYDVTRAPVFEQVARDVRRELTVDVVVAHNAHVDVGALQRHLGDWDCPIVVDTLRLAKQLLPGQLSYRLGALAEGLGLTTGLPPNLTPHRATYDALVCARLLVHLVQQCDGAAALRRAVASTADAGHDRLF
jgi:exodeoxyribonuclease X